MLVGADWGGGDDTEIQVRSRDANGWSEWVELHVSDEHDPDESSAEYAEAGTSTVSDPIYLGRVDDVQLRVRGARPTLRLKLIEIGGDLTWTPERAPAGAAKAATEAPMIRPRASWGADESLRSHTPDYADDVRFSVLHHEGGQPRWTQSAIDAGCRDADDAIRAIYEYHTRYRGYWDIAYNFVVDPCGGVWEGRAGGVDRALMGAHAGGWNEGSVGVLVPCGRGIDSTTTCRS